MKKRIKLKKKIILITVAILVLLTGIFTFYQVRIAPVIISMSRAKVQALSMSAINHSITAVITDGIEYNDLINIVTDEKGKIQALQTKASKVNILARQMASIAQHHIEKLGQQGITIPLGAFSGYTMFAAEGPEINVKIVPVSAVNCEFVSEFIEAGINQTMHKIYLKLYAEIRVVLPAVSETIVTSTQILIAESIIVGEVPSTYLKSFRMSEMLDLIP